MEANYYGIRQGRFDFKIDPDTECFLGLDDCYYDSLPEAAFFGQLGLCGCGNREANHALACEIVGCFDRDKVGWEKGSGMAAVAELVKAKPEEAAELLVQFLDTKDLLEHGGSVYGSWLTERGRQFLEIGPIPND